MVIASIAFVVYQNYFQKPETKTILANRITPFSGFAGCEDMPAFSPDGKLLAFAWDGGEEGGKFDVYVKLVGAGEPVRLTTDERDDIYPKFSPDGKSIAFVRSFANHDEVFLIPALGGAERRICKLFSGSYSLSFAPDGQTLSVIDMDSASKQYAVHLVNLQTGEKRRVTAQAEFVGETTPRFSPDGKRLAFVRILGDKNQDLFVASTDEIPAAARQITFDRAVINSLSWSADGQSIFFTSYRANKQTNLWRIAASWNWLRRAAKI